MRLGGLAGFAADVNDVGAERRGDAGEVEPVHALKDGVPVEVRGGSLLNRGMRTVINADRAALGSALFIIIDAHTVAAAGNLRGVYAVAAQGVDRGLADGVRGQLGDKRRVHAVVCQRDRDVGFAAAKAEF